MATPNKPGGANLMSTSQPVPARTGVGSTVHHMASTTAASGVPLPRTTATPFANLQQGILAMSMQASQKTAAVTSQTSLRPVAPLLTTRGQPAPGPSPKKKIKIEEVEPATEEIAVSRKLILDERLSQMHEIKQSYIDNLTECFFLQQGRQMMDFYQWRKKPAPQLLHFLKSGMLDSDDEEDTLLKYLPDRRSLDSEVKVSSVGGVLPSSTPVATSTTLPASVAALSQQGPDLSRVPGGRHGMVYGHVHPSLHSMPVPIVLPVHTSPAGLSLGRVGTMSTGSGSLLGPGSSIHRSVSDSRLSMLTAQATKTVMTATASGTSVKKTPPGSPGRPRKNSFDGTNIKGISSQEAIVERAKQEAQVMSRVAELRKEGLWSSRRLPKVQEPPRNKAHWDYLLEEMQWLAADFQQERKWKKTCARKIAKMVAKYFQDIEQKELRAEKEETMKLKRTAGQLAKMVKEFWSNIEKVVQYKQNSRLDEKRKKAMDMHLNFIVDQTEKFSTWLSEGLTGQNSNAGSLNTTPASSLAGDEEFKPAESESDDEETIDKDEEGIDEAETQDEVAALQKESELPLDQLIESLPKEILEKPAPLDDPHDEADEQGETTKKSDKDFKAESDESDVEETIDEQEEHEDDSEQKKELDELKDEGEMSIDELRAKYAAAYEVEMPVDSGEESTDIDQSDWEESEDEEEEEEEEVMEEEEEVDVEGGEDVGLEALVEEEKPQEVKVPEGGAREERDQALTEIAAEAASLQPKGYTLESAEVQTKVPFLLKHTLREYQHVGLDWLATMYEKRLNGILADEMGLGKTIQTIALLAHLACEKGIWGPHLIVVPTSVMLNWEMEIKKWCPSFKILTYYGSQKERKQKRMGWTKTNAFHICITSYKLVIQDHTSFRRKKWKYLILDEAQNIKNFKSQRWQTLLNFNSMRRLLLTGTPLQNSLMELWSLMHFLMPNVFQSHKDFKEWFANPLTGMIEGSHEYNESLIRRLHKVLRPFLLRRLKDDVEKQMPKKYEHIVMCHLSKRQRFLYDEFMAQGKTKETLASGHFMSVINILMQLRKVCNHPSLFDPRPIVSPFQMQGMTYHTASEILRVVADNPLAKLDLHRYPGLADMERDLPAFIAHRVRKLQTGRKLIEEIDIAPPAPSRPPQGKLKMNAIRSVSPGLQTGRASPMVINRSSSPAPTSLAVPSSVSSTIQSTPRVTVAPVTTASVTTAASVVSTSGQPTPPVSSQPITVQIQHTDQGTRLVVPSGQLSSLPGFIQIVQTSTGQHLIATSAPSVASTVASTTVLVNGSPVVSMATSSARTIMSTATSQVKMSAAIHSGSTSQSNSLAGHQIKPVMRVSPLATVSTHTNGDEHGFTTATSTSSRPATKVTYSSQILKHWEREKLQKKKKDPFFFETVYDKEQKWRRERLQFISRTNHQHCEVKPVYGQDLREAINIFRDPYLSKTYRTRDTSLWHGPGYIHCQCAKLCPNPQHPNNLWNQTKVLSDICHSPEQYLEEMEALLDRFVFAIPTVQTPPIQMHTSHPPPSYRRDEAYRDYLLRTSLSPRAANYHQISTRMTVQFPELRLIQYDCGKLQTLDILLRRLKSGDHRVLIFTQMTRMLDILESFLSYHGHRYLRLDGTTRVEQRQMLMDRFNADRRIFVFILSTRSGGIGVNLTGADTVIFYDSDWNPTMDAQAQDRCHRIGQTRDVHIYRLVSEKTVEENILKKANQKRMLGDMAIEGGNFTTAFFKQNTISELFSEPSGLESLVKEKEHEERVKKEKEEQAERERKAEKEKQDRLALQQFEKALAENEEETDVVAIEQVKAEQKAELAEFDENIPWDEKEAELREEESHVEQELAMLHNELTPIERYAVQFTEEQMDPVNQEELLVAEEDIEAAKKDWELNRLKALKEEEERRAEMEEDEMLYTYSRDDAYQQVKKRNKQLVLDARKAAVENKAANTLSSPRKNNRNSVGSVEHEESSPKPWVYRTPKIILDMARNKGNQKMDESGENGINKSNKKSKKSKKEDDTYEEVDVETVTGVDLLSESAKKQTKKKLVQKVDKPEKMLMKRPKKIKADKPNHMPKITTVQPGAVLTSTSQSVDATPLTSLPGYSSSPAVSYSYALSNSLTPTKSVRENLFEKLQSPPKPVQADRANIFEQFGAQTPVGSVGVAQQALLQPNTLGASTVRFVNTPQGKQMVMVSSSQPGIQTAQNVVLLQNIQQAFPQGFVVGNNVVSLQGTPLNLATLRAQTTPTTPVINLQGARLAGNQQVLAPRLAARIVTPVSTQQPFVQRLVSAGSVNVSVPGVQGLAVPQLGTIQGLANLQQLQATQQIRMQPAPLIQTSGGQTIAVQNIAPQQPHRKTTTQTIASLIANNKGSKEGIAPAQSPAASQIPATVSSSVNLANIMKAQIPPSSPSSKVKVNPAVAKLVASHIQAASQQSIKQQQQQVAVKTTTQHAKVPTIISLGSSSTQNSSPTVVKLVSASSLNAGNTVKASQPGTKSQIIKTPVSGAGVTPRGDSPVAKINIKGLPPGVSIPVSLVNSLVSGSIGGISKANLSILKAAAAQSANKNVVRLSNANVNVNAKTSSSPVPQLVTVAQNSAGIQSPKPASPSVIRTPMTTAQGSPTLQAWSNPNLVIRTRRANAQAKSVQAVPSPNNSPSIQLPTPTTIHVNNNNTITVSQMPAIGTIPTVVLDADMPALGKKLDQGVHVEVSNVQTNGTSEDMETD